MTDCTVIYFKSRVVFYVVYFCWYIRDQTESSLFINFNSFTIGCDFGASIECSFNNNGCIKKFTMSQITTVWSGSECVLFISLFMVYYFCGIPRTAEFIIVNVIIYFRMCLFLITYRKTWVFKVPYLINLKVPYWLLIYLSANYFLLRRPLENFFLSPKIWFKLLKIKEDSFPSVKDFQIIQDFLFKILGI